MSLLAESLVEEWLNRKSFFTIRGIKHGIGELDLLGIQREASGLVIGWHVEVQVSFRPIGYITKTTKDMAKSSGRARGTAKLRTPNEIEICAREWVRSKFSGKDKERVRESLWSGVQWSFHLVHGVVKEPKELEVFKCSVNCSMNYHIVLSTTTRDQRGVILLRLLVTMIRKNSNHRWLIKSPQAVISLTSPAKIDP